MLDQDTALALLTIADQCRARVVLMGDRHQLPAVGRGGVLDLAAACAPPSAQLTLEVVHRFDDPAYADLSHLMRRGERSGEVFDALLARGEIRIHATNVERRQALTLESGLVIADTHEQVEGLNAAIRQGRVLRGEVDPRGAVTTSRGECIGVGDQIATRSSDRTLDVANRDTWSVTAVDQEGASRSPMAPGCDDCQGSTLSGSSSSAIPATPTAPKAKPSTPHTSSLASTPAQPPRASP